MRTATRFQIATAAVLLVALTAAGAQAAASEKTNWLGVSMQELTPSMQKALQLDEKTGGVLISNVVEDSPAERGGLQVGDIVVTFDGHRIAGVEDLQRAVRKAATDAPVEVVVIREGERKTFEVELAEREDAMTWIMRDDDGGVWSWHGDAAEAPEILRRHGMGWQRIAADHGWLGVQLEDLGEQLGDYFGVEKGAGVLISAVEEDSPAAKAGLQAGDVIVAIEGEEVTSSGELRDELGDTEPNQEVELAIVRRGDRDEVKVTLGEIPEDMIGSGPFHWREPDLSMRGAPRVWRFEPQSERWREMMEHHEGLREDEVEQLREELRGLREELDQLREQLQH
jgi:predicted metalloprotease with PDZ domain